VARIPWPHLQWASAFILSGVDAWFSANLRGDTLVLFPFDQAYFSSLTMISIISYRTQCMPFQPRRLLIMWYAQSQLWDLNPQLWLNWWPDTPQWTQFSSVLLLTREKLYPWLHLQLPRRKELLKRSLLR
jgi:hypothetical protein